MESPPKGKIPSVNTSQTFDTRADALRVAKLLGCDKVHETGKGWRPCTSTQGLAILIKKGEKAHSLFHSREGQKAQRHIVDPELGEEKKKAPKRKKRVRKVWEPMRERGVASIQGGGPGLTSGKDAQPDGVVAVLIPSESSIKPYLREGGLPLDEMHLTLGYFGKSEKADLVLKENLVTWAYTLSMEEGPIEAQVKGVARLGNDDPQAVVILVENQKLMDLRADLDMGLRSLHLDRTHPGFIPHITLSYGGSLDVKPDSNIVFSHIGIWWGAERIALPLQNAVSVNS